MPGLPLVVRETTNLGCNCSRSRSVDQMCRQDSRVHLSAEETIAAEESLSIYCKPVELYNILQRRAVWHPSFLQRCLHYKIQAKQNRRIQMTVVLSGFVNDGVRSQNILPLYVLLATPVSGIAVAGHSAVYQLSRACVLTALSECGWKDQVTANFVIPEIRKLNANAKAGNLTILLVSPGEHRNGFGENGLLKDQLDLASFSSKFEGYCLWGKLPIELLRSSWEKSANLSLGHRAEVQSTIDMHASFLEKKMSEESRDSGLQSKLRGSLDEENCIMFQTSHNCTVSSPKRVQVSISAQEIGAKERSPYDSYTYDDVPPASLSHIIRLRTGNVIFNYRYYNNSLQKTEVTEDFSCPFCLVQCASFKGLRYHLTSSHDLFNFEFWVTEEYQAVNVSVKSDIWRSEVVADGVDPRLQTFFFCSKPLRRRRSNNSVQNARYVHPHVVKLDSAGAARVDPCEGCSEKNATTSSCLMPTTTGPEEAVPLKESDRFGNDGYSNREDEEKTPLQPERLQSEHYGPENPGATECTDNVPSTPNTADVCTATTQPCAGNEFAPPVSQSNLAPPAMLQFAKTRKLSVERADPRNRLLLQKRQFFHSHRAQPMALEQVLSDRDSEDEVDDDIADFEDRRMLDDFVDVTKDEKQIMHLWNSFVRKQRVLADGHIPWACEAFSRLHGQDLVCTPALIWCWRLFMIKLWNHSLLDARTMNNCNIILQNFRNGGDNSDSRQS